MTGCRCKISLIIVLVSQFSIQAFSQQFNYRDSLAKYNIEKPELKPQLHYSVGSTLTVVPHLGTVTGFTISPYLSLPLSPKLSVDGGIIAGRYYSTIHNFNSEDAMYGAFNELSVYGSASYHINSQLTVYGAAIKQLSPASPINILPKSSYTFGSTFKFGNFSIGAALQMSKWNNTFSPLPFNDYKRFNSPYEW